jgi:hypothetical protein
MATFGKIDLGISQPNILCGAGFKLNKPAASDFIFEDSGFQIILQKDSHVVIVKYEKRFPSLETLLESAYTDAQKGLDILAMSLRYFYSLPIAHYDHLLWTMENAVTKVRVQNSSGLNIRIETFWKKTNIIDGTKENSKNIPLPLWHEAFRYIRYSQLRDDLYASYREAFLAVEAFLSSFAPRIRGEQETAWHLRANRQLESEGLNFTLIVSAPGLDSVDAFVTEQFKAQRCAHFHSKAGNDHFLPGVLSDRRLVTDSLEKLGRYLIEASKIICGVQSPVGALTFNGMKMHIETFAKELTLAVCSDSQLVNPEDTDVSPNGLQVTDLQTVYEGIIDGLGYEFGFLGTIDVKDMKSKSIETTASFVPDALMTRGTIPELDLCGIDRFEYRQIFYFAGNAGLKGGFSL